MQACADIDLNPLFDYVYLDSSSRIDLTQIQCSYNKECKLVHMYINPLCDYWSFSTKDWGQPKAFPQA